MNKLDLIHLIMIHFDLRTFHCRVLGLQFRQMTMHRVQKLEHTISLSHYFSMREHSKPHLQVLPALICAASSSAIEF